MRVTVCRPVGYRGPASFMSSTRKIDNGMSDHLDTNSPPPLDARLIEWLERVFPDQAPNPGTPLDRLWWDAGRASVVRTLRRMYNGQLETARENTTELLT